MTDYRDRPDAEIASNFEQLCDDVLTQIGDQLYALTEEHVPLDEEIKDAMSCDEPLYDDWDVVRYMGEVGCPICRRGDTIFVGDLTPPCTAGDAISGPNRVPDSVVNISGVFTHTRSMERRRLRRISKHQSAMGRRLCALVGTSVGNLR